MKTDMIQITKAPEDVLNTLDRIEWIARYAGMTQKQAANMRLIGEELISATKNILDVFEGQLWMETDDKTFALHLRAKKPAYTEDRKKLIALSKAGKATPPKGLFARLGAVLEQCLLPESGDSDADMLASYAVFSDYTLFSEGIHGVGPIYTCHYLPVYTKKEQREKPKDALEGIEKSIIDAFVDDMLVTLQNGCVEITAVKNL